MATIISILGQRISLQLTGTMSMVTVAKAALGCGCDQVEGVPLPRSKEMMLIDESGKAKGLPLNEHATAWAIANHGIDPWDCIVGPVIVLSEHEVEAML